MRRLGASVVVALTLGTLAQVGASTTVYPSVAFRVECAASHQAGDDPLLHPGHAGASHLHQFFGNISTSERSDVAALMAASTTCDDSKDLSAYWTPTPIGASWVRLRAYYDRGSLPPSSVTVPPAGLGAVGGLRRRADVAWSCGRSVDAAGWVASPPPCAQGKVLRARVVFGQCFSGRLPTRGPAELVEPVAGRCPRTHPVGIPRLRLVLDASGPIRALSAGPVGEMHADVITAWDDRRLGDLVRRCIRGERVRGNDTRLCRPAGLAHS